MKARKAIHSAFAPESILHADGSGDLLHCVFSAGNLGIVSVGEAIEYWELNKSAKPKSGGMWWTWSGPLWKWSAEAVLKFLQAKNVPVSNDDVLHAFKQHDAALNSQYSVWVPITETI